MKRTRAVAILLVLTMAITVLAGCGNGSGGTTTPPTSSGTTTPPAGGGTTAPPAGGGSGWAPPKDMTFIAGAAAGGGLDGLARNVVQALNATNIVEQTIKVENMVGGTGMVAIQHVGEVRKGNDNVLLSGAGGLMPAEIANNTAVRQKHLTPIARMVLETMCMVVAADNDELDSLETFVKMMQEDPKSLVFGGNMPPAEDYLSMVLICNAIGVDYSQCEYVYYDGGGECLPALMGGHIDVSFSGTSEWAAAVEAGQVRALGVAAESDRVGGVFSDVPTFREAGVDFVWQNWRGVLGPIDMSQEAIDYWREKLKEASESEVWMEICDRTLYEPGFMTDGFDQFLIDYEAQCEEALKLAGLI